jgi:hypothetical protein
MAVFGKKDKRDWADDLLATGLQESVQSLEYHIPFSFLAGGGADPNPIGHELPEECTPQRVHFSSQRFAFLPGTRDFNTKKRRALDRSAAVGA